jgi:hypothetical protein
MSMSIQSGPRVVKGRVGWLVRCRARFRSRSGPGCLPGRPGAAGRVASWRQLSGPLLATGTGGRPPGPPVGTGAPSGPQRRDQLVAPAALGLSAVIIGAVVNVLDRHQAEEEADALPTARQ